MTRHRKERLSRRSMAAFGLGTIASIAFRRGGTAEQQDDSTVIEDSFPFPYIRTGQVVYVPNDRLDRPFSEVDLGQIVTLVKFTDEHEATNPIFEAREESAWPLAVGTPVYSVNGYANSFRLAAELYGKLTLFEGLYNRRAKSGRDLFDIGGKVEWIEAEWFSYFLQQREVANVRDPKTVEQILGYILAAPNTPLSTVCCEVIYTFSFHLKDGTATLPIRYEPRQSIVAHGSHLSLPESFATVVDEAFEAAASATPIASPEIGS